MFIRAPTLWSFGFVAVLLAKLALLHIDAGDWIRNVIIAAASLTLIFAIDRGDLKRIEMLRKNE